jgi:hypothetical protein
MPGSKNLDREAILRTHQEQTARRTIQAEETILPVQDTASLNYNRHLKTEGLGYISGRTLGVNIHICLAVTASGLALGVLDQKPHNREDAQDESRTHESRKVRPPEEKESYRRVQTLGESATGIPQGVKAVSDASGKGICMSFLTRQSRAGNCF